MNECMYGFHWIGWRLKKRSKKHCNLSLRPAVGCYAIKHFVEVISVSTPKKRCRDESTVTSVSRV